MKHIRYLHSKDYLTNACLIPSKLPLLFQRNNNLEFSNSNISLYKKL